MSNDGLLERIAKIAGIDKKKAFDALVAVFDGQLDLAFPTTFDGQSIGVTVEIVVHQPPPPGPAKKHHRRLHNPGELIKFIAETAGISPDQAGKVLGVVTQGIIEVGFDAGLRLSLSNDQY